MGNLLEYLDYVGLSRVLTRIKEKIPSKVSQLDNDSEFISSKPLLSATYSDLYYGANSTNNGYFEPICVRPKDTTKVYGTYYIRFRMSTTSTGYPNYANYSDVEVWFNRTGSVNCYRCWNWRVGSYLHYYVGVCYPSTNANFNTKGTHLGVGITSGNNYNNANYKRDTLIEILEVSDDLVVTLDKPEDTKQYTKMPWYNATDYPNHTTLNAVDVGLQETGDANTYDRTYFGNTSMTVSSRFRSVANTLNAFDQDGKYFSLGQYGTAADTTTRYTATSKGEWVSGTAYAIGDYVHYTNDIYYRCIKAHAASASILPTNTTYWQVYREYNHNGIDYKRGLFYGGANYAKGATTTMSIYFAITGIDLRYTFNCLASNAAANTLGTEMGKNVYIRGYIKDGLFYIAPTTVTYSSNPYYKCWTQDPVDENIEVDGVSYSACYWLIGSAYYNSSYATRGYQINLFQDNPMFVFNNGKLVEYSDILPSEYAPSELENEDLEPKAGDTYPTAFAKMHKAILDNEISTVAALNECKTYIKDIVDNMDMSGGTLSEYYVTSEDSHEDLRLQAGNSFEIAFSKLEKAILDNEYLVSEAMIDMDNRIRRIESKL